MDPAPEDTRLQERWKLALVLGVSLFVAYMDRLNVSMAMPLLSAEFGWTTQQTQDYGSLLMSVFWIGYGLANIFLSPVARRFGPRKSLSVIVALWALFTALGAVASQILMLFAATRVLLGLGEGVHFPMMSMLTKNWFPLGERSRANSVWIGGLFLAILLSPVLLVPLMSTFGWRSGFLVLAVVGLGLTLPLIRWVVYDTPGESPRVGESERMLLEAAVTHEELVTPDQERIRILLGAPFLLLLAAGMLNNLVAQGLNGWLPTYFTNVKGIPFADITWFVTIPYAASLVGLLFWAWLGDRSSRRGLLAASGFVGTAVCLYFALTAYSLSASLAWFTGAVFMVTAFPSCEFAFVQRVLPRAQIAECTGIYNGLSTMIGGGLGPIVMSAMIGEASATSFLMILLPCALAAATIYWLGRTLSY